MDKRLVAFERLLGIMDKLRAECPWDKKQTIESLRTLTIEETFELSDAIIDKDSKAISSELGDLFLHLVFYAKIGEEQGDFTLEQVLNKIGDKLIFRHPHIYAKNEMGENLQEVKGEEEVKSNWEKLKLKEGNMSVLSGVPKSLPALIKATRIQEKVKGVGFEWDDIKDVWNKVYEEIDELKEAIENQNTEEIELELGDVFFSLTNLSRHLNLNPEDALEKVNKKFMKRFQLMEQMIKEDGLDISNLNLEKLDEFWVKAKNKIKKID